MKKIILLIGLVLAVNLSAQQSIKNKFGKGIINMVAEDSSYSVKMGARFQNLFIYETPLVDGIDFYDDADVDFFLRRARIKFDGFAFSPKVIYKIELGLSNKDIGSPNSGTNDAARIVLDAVVKWNFAQNFWLWVGQTKLPGNRERVISSQKLQFVDRSLANSKYNIDRDQGLQLRHSFKVGEMVFREIASWSIGEGRNYVKSNRGGFDYTGRIEFLPMGEFTKKGDYFSSDLKREEKPKLAIGVTYDYHDNAVRERGQQGDYMIGERDLQSIMADLMFKFKGISVMSEYISKTTDFPMLYDSSGIASGTFYVGSGMNFQAGYLLKNNWEVAGRYTVITPDSETGNSNITMYTLGISKYVVGHNLKFQTDISYTQEDSKDDKLMWRMQVEVSF